MSIQALGPIKSPIQWVLRVKQPEYEADHLSPFSAEVNAWSSTSTLSYAFMALYN